MKVSKEKLLTFLLGFAFSVKDEFSCKEIPHIDKYNGKAFADNIVLVNGNKRAEHGIFDKKSCRLKNIVFRKGGNNKLSKSQTDNADNGKADKICCTVFDFSLCKNPESRNDIIDGKTDNKAEYDCPSFGHLKEFLAENHDKRIHNRGKTAHKYASEKLYSCVARFTDKELLKKIFHNKVLRGLCSPVFFIVLYIEQESEKSKDCKSPRTDVEIVKKTGKVAYKEVIK